MAIEIKIPTLGESITEVTLAKWLKKSGDAVKLDEPIGELESDKATFELTAPQAGTLEIVTEEGTQIPIGTIVAKVTDAPQNGNAKAEAPKTTPTAPPETPVKKEETSSSAPPSKTVEIRVSALGESITEVTIGNWLKKEGDTVKTDEILCEIESDKATFELPASASGILHIIAKQGDVLPIGGLICTVQTSNQAVANNTTPTTPENNTQKPEVNNTNEKSYATGYPSPSAAKILAEKGIDTKNVQGTGIDGRITKEDATKAENKPAEKSTNLTSPQTEMQKTIGVGIRNSRREKMTSLRKTIAKRLVMAKNETAMLTTFNEVNMKPIMDLRARHKDKFKEKYNVGLGFMSFFTKACCLALQEFPAVNAMIDGEELIYNDFCDISIAVSAPKGLVVPVIRNAEKMSFADIEKEIVVLATKAKDNKLSIDEMTGGTFTITNGGIFGSMMSTPIINYPQAAILGMHNIVERPMAVNGQVQILPMMYVALSYDHRIIDGRESVGFLVRVKQLLEEPERLLLGI